MEPGEDKSDNLLKCCKNNKQKMLQTVKLKLTDTKDKNIRDYQKTNTNTDLSYKPK